MQYLVFDDMTQCTEEAVKQLLPLVPDFRREQALKYHHTFGQFCCLKSWQMLQTPPSPLGKGDVYYNEHGKPFIKGAPEFSISHCKTAIAVVINDTPIGIDVESIRRIEPSLIARTMNDEEQTLIRNAEDPQRAFTRLWTMKEAYLKYLGTGIVDNLHMVLEKVDLVRFTIIEKENYFLSIYY